MPSLLLLALPALAQGFDARGGIPLPESADPADAPWTVGRTSRGVAAVRLSYADRPLVRTFPDGEVVSVVDDLVGLEITALTPALGPVRIGAVLPPMLVQIGGENGGVAPGDLLVFVPIGAEPGDHWIAVTPFVRVPTGDAARFVGENGPGFGGLASVHLRAGVLAVAGDGGLDITSATEIAEWPGGPTALGAGSVGVVPVDALGVHALIRTRSPLASSLASVPSETGLAVRWQAGRVFGGVSAARALTRGIGASAARVEASVGFSPPVKDDLPFAIDEVPPPPPLDRLRVLGSTGSAVRAAEVTFATASGPAVVTTDAEGLATVPAGAAGTVRVEQQGFAALEVALQPEGPEQAVTLVRPPVPVSLRVVDEKGQAVKVPLTVDPAVELALDEVGTWQGAVAPGKYVVTSAVEGLGLQARTIVVDEHRTDPLVVDLVLQPSAGEASLRIEVTDPLGHPVESAEVKLDGRPLGNTGTGGDLVVKGLAAKPAKLVLDADPYVAPPEREVLPGPDAVARVVVDWPDGGVLVRAAGPDGAVTDALVAFQGPASLPPAPLGADGERLFTVRPGPWAVIASSPTLGTQERRFTVAPGDELVKIEIVFEPAENGDADLTVTVLGPEGPLPNAAVALGGKPYGLTGPDGSLRLLDLQRGPRSLAVEAPLLRPYGGTVDLFGGGQAVDVPVRWAPGAVEVVVRDPEDRPIDAVLAGRAGERALPVVRLGDDGLERVQLEVGTWDLALSDPRFGTQVRTLTVREDDEGLRRVAIRMLPPDDDGGRLRLTVSDPEGQPVEGARVFLGGQLLGTTTDGGLDAQALARTTSELRVEAAALEPASKRVRVTEDTPIAMALTWAPGAARVTVAGPQGPADAVVAASGPASVAPRRTGADGKVLLGLAPGEWRVLASAPDLGAAEVDATLPTAAVLTPIELHLLPAPPPDAAILLVRVRDADGKPIPGAKVKIGDRDLLTSPGGNALFTDLVPGKVELAIAGGYGLEERAIAFELPGGSHERIVVLERTLRAVEVRVVDREKKPITAKVVAEGAATLQAEATPAKPAALSLPPGRWSVTARAPEGVGTEALDIAVGTEPVAIELVVAPTESRMEGGAVVLGRAVPFDLDQATLRPDAVPILDDVARLLRAESGIVRVEIAGHTDDLGGVAYNQDLSERRAAAVREALVARGIDPERLVAKGYGLLRPLASGTDEASRAQNRRVEIVVLERTAPR